MMTTTPPAIGTTNPAGISGGSSAPTRIPQFGARAILASSRFKELDRRGSFYEGTQHAYKEFDFDGRLCMPNGISGALGALAMVTAEQIGTYIPLRARRPSFPYRLAKVVVDSFTRLVFGERRFPLVRVEGDPVTQDWMAAVVKAGRLPSKMLRARAIGGSTGTVGLSWAFDRRGRPKFEAHHGKHLVVSEWEDRDELIPAAVSEVYLTKREEWDPDERRMAMKGYWCRRDWTPDGDLVFPDIPYEHGQDPYWMRPDPALTVMHGHGKCHMQWIQNLPTDDIDGLPDYDSCYDQFDGLDVLLSVIMRGAIANLDPTLVLKLPKEVQDQVTMMGKPVMKGSDNVLSVGEGDAAYLELTGQSLKAGVDLLWAERKTVLETCECVVLDPNEVASQGVSAVSIRAMYAAMLGKGDGLREQYEMPMKRGLEDMHEYATTEMTKVSVQSPGLDGPTELFVNLPPRVERLPKQDEEGNPLFDETGKRVEEIRKTERVPGEGGDLEFHWPDYFPPTPKDKQDAVTSLTAANGGKPIMSQQTSVEEAAAVFGHESDEEWARVQRQNVDDAQQQMAQASAFGTGGDFQGGRVDAAGDLPEGAQPKQMGGGNPGSRKGPPGQDEHDDVTDVVGALDR